MVRQVEMKIEIRTATATHRKCRNRRAYMRYCIGQVPQVRNAVLRLGRNRGHFIAQPKIHGEIFLQAKVILYVGAEQGLTQSDIWHIKTARSLEYQRAIGQKVL